MSEALIDKTPIANSPTNRPALRRSPHVATAAEAMKNYAKNRARTWYKDGVTPDDVTGKYAFQRLRQTWFTPQVDPKFKLRRDDKFYAIGSCFARGLENSLAGHKMIVESAAPEFAKFQPANREAGSGLGFINKYNTYSILNELRWALDPDSEFPRDSIVPLTDTTWYDPHTTPTLNFVGLDETLERLYADASGDEAHTELSRHHHYPRACRSVARCSGRRVCQLHSHSIFVQDSTRPIRISSN